MRQATDQECPDCDDQLRYYDRHLATLARNADLVRLRMGEVLHALGEHGANELGFSSASDWVRQRFGYSPRVARDWNLLVRRLADLPKLHRALRARELSMSMVQLLARYATPETEVELIGRARGRTIRAMRAELRDPAETGEDEREPERCTISVTLDQEDAWHFEGTRKLVEAVGGGTSNDTVIEALLAEGLTELVGDRRDLALPDGIDPGTPAALRRRESRRAEDAARAAREEAAEVRAGEHPLEVDFVDADAPMPVDAGGLDAHAVELARVIADVDVTIGEVARHFVSLGGWRRLRYTSFEHYTRERLGMSESAVQARMTLAARCALMPAIRTAIVAGRLGFECAQHIARVATPVTVDAWIERAAVRTVKHLREELDAAEILARASADRMRLVPPNDAALETVHDLEREALAVAITAGTQTSAATSTGPASRPGRVTLHLHMTEDLAGFYRGLETLHRWERQGEHGAPMPFLVWLSSTFRRVWAGSVAADVAYADVYLRDRYRCASPVCTRRDVTPHHVHFRSRGGGDERSNLISVCSVCHLDLVHGGRMTVSGLAPGGLSWRLGQAALRVRGRVVE